MKLIAIVKNENNALKKIEMEYNTKKEFKEDLEANGYKVKTIYTEIQFKALDYAFDPKDVFNKSLLNQIIKENNL